MKKPYRMVLYDAETGAAVGQKHFRFCFDEPDADEHQIRTKGAELMRDAYVIAGKAWK